MAADAPVAPSALPPDPLPPFRAWLPAVGSVLARPTLWWTGVRQVFALAPRGWWRRWPLLPLPAPAYLRFRLITAYGATDTAPLPEDVVSYLRWCRAWRRAGWGGRG
jgi:hypothetical protein